MRENISGICTMYCVLNHLLDKLRKITHMYIYTFIEIMYLETEREHPWDLYKYLCIRAIYCISRTATRWNTLQHAETHCCVCFRNSSSKMREILHIYAYIHEYVFRSHQCSLSMYRCTFSIYSVAVCCGVLQCVAVCCSVSQCVTVCGSPLVIAAHQYCRVLIYGGRTSIRRIHI